MTNVSQAKIDNNTEAGTPTSPKHKSNARMAADFLTKLQPQGPWHVFAIDPDVANAITAKTFDSRKQIEQFVIRHDGKNNLYYGLNQSKKRDHKPAKDDIIGVDFVHGDFDPKDDETAEDAKKRYIEQLQAFDAKLPANVIVDSGNGLQALWELSQLFKKKNSHRRIEEINKRLTQHFGSKTGAQDVSRILRLPYTMNLPNATKRKAGRQATRATVLRFEFDKRGTKLARFEKLFPTPKPVSSQGALPTTQSFDLPLHLQHAVQSPPPTGQRSEMFQSVVLAMRRMGMSAIATVGYLERFPHGLAQRYIEQGRLAREVDRVLDKRNNAAQPSEPVEIVAYTGREIMEMKHAPLKWIVEGLLPEGLSLLGGRPKIGKSWISLQIAIAIEAALPLFADNEGYTCRQGDVLYLALEDGLRRMNRRLEKLKAKHPDRLTFAFDWPSCDDGGIEALREWLTEHPNTRLVIIDTLKRFRPKMIKGEQLYDYDYRAGQLLQKVAQEFGIAIVVVHHTRKSEAEDPLDTVSGTTGLTAGVDQVMVLHRVQNEFNLAIRGRDIEESCFALSFQKETCTWAMLGDAEEVGRSARERVVLDELAQAGADGLPQKELSKICGIPEAATRALLHRMTRKHLVKTVSRGCYALAGGHLAEHPNKANI